MAVGLTYGGEQRDDELYEGLKPFADHLEELTGDSEDFQAAGLHRARYTGILDGIGKTREC